VRRFEEGGRRTNPVPPRTSWFRKVRSDRRGAGPACAGNQRVRGAGNAFTPGLPDNARRLADMQRSPSRFSSS
jgi:hypothetical protein